MGRPWTPGGEPATALAPERRCGVSAVVSSEGAAFPGRLGREMALGDARPRPRPRPRAPARPRPCPRAPARPRPCPRARPRPLPRPRARPLPLPRPATVPPPRRLHLARRRPACAAAVLGTLGPLAKPARCAARPGRPRYTTTPTDRRGAAGTAALHDNPGRPRASCSAGVPPARSTSPPRAARWPPTIGRLDPAPGSATAPGSGGREGPRGPAA